MDEQTIGFQGRHKDKKKIKSKREGDDFMADCYFDNSVSCSFNFRNMPPPIKCVRLKLSILCSRVLGLFDALSNSNYKFWVDNMHSSANFLVQSLNYKAHAMVE